MPRIPNDRLKRALRVLLLLAISVAMLAGIGTWALSPAPIYVRITVVPRALDVYDDHAGHQGLASEVNVTNLSTRTIWFLGLPGTPVYTTEQLVGREWKLSTASVTRGPTYLGLPKEWASLRPMETITIAASPISEKATELRVAVPFTSEWNTPTRAHWVFSPLVKIVKRGALYLAEVEPGAQQEEQIVRLPWLSARSTSTNGSRP